MLRLIWLSLEGLTHYHFLNQLECHCGAKEFSVDARLTRKVEHGVCSTRPRCEPFCAFKQRRIVGDAVKPADCLECSKTVVACGRISCACGRVWNVQDGKPDFGARLVDGAGNGKLQIIETDFATDPRWNPFVNRHPQGLIYHHSLWLSALRNEFGQETLPLACVDENGQFKGIFPMLYTRGLPCGVLCVGGQATGRRLASLPRTPVAGPLGTSRTVDELLLREAVRRVKEMPGTTLQIKVDTKNLDGIVDGMEGTFWRKSYVLELPRRLGDALRFGNAKGRHKVAWAVSKAVRLGVKVREGKNEEDLAGWYRLYLETMRRVVVLARPYSFFQELWRTMRPRGMIKLLLAERSGNDGNDLLAGSILLVYGTTVHYGFTGCNTPALALHANDLLQWEAIDSACKEGFRYYDFGEVGAECPELARFKSKWSAKAIPLYRYHCPSLHSSEAHAVAEPSHFRWVRQIWQHLPLGLTEMLGCQIFRRL